MFRRIGDFEESWRVESEATLSVLSQLSDGSLNQKVTPRGRSLAFLGWHLVRTMREMLGHAGIRLEGPPEEEAIPTKASHIKEAYGKWACELAGAVRRACTDEMLSDPVEIYGETWERGKVLLALILHQAHHRGQMTVLMRQAGLPVPGVYGPSLEEWATLGLPPMQ